MNKSVLNAENKTLSQNFGMALSVVRKRLQMTQIDLATEVGISQKYLSDVENGKRNVSLDMVEKILLVLHMKPSDFFLEIENCK